MDFKQARADILDWIVNFVEKPNPLLSGWSPCPYARQARLQNRLDIRRGLDPFADLLSTGSMQNFDVIAFVYDPNKWSADEFNYMIDASNRGFLTNRNLLALADHPDSVELVNGLTFNQGKYAITFLQDLDKLNQAAKDIAKKGYYKDWPEEYLIDLFKFRVDPRE